MQTGSNRRSRWSLMLALLMALAMIAGACGSDDSDEASDKTDESSDTDTDESSDTDTDESSDTDEPDTDEPDAEPSAGGGEMVVGRADSMLGWNPDNGFSFPDYQTYLAVYGTLLVPGSDGLSLDPGLAESWEFDPDALTYTFVLREGGFPDGTPVTSADVAFSVSQWQAGPVWGPAFAAIDSVDTPDDSTVVFNLNSPDTYLPNLLATGNGAIFPVDFGGQSAEDFFAKPYGAGAFAVESWSPQIETVLVANENFYGGAPAIDTLTYREFADQDTMLLAFEDGQIDMVEYVQPDRADQLNALKVSPAAGVVVIAPNHAEGRATADVNFRRAVSLGINREDLAAVYGGNVTPAQGILAAGVSNSVGLQDGDWTTFDPDAAVAALAESSSAGSASVSLMYQSDKQLDAGLATVVQAQLADIGIDVTVEGFDALTYSDRYIAGDYDLAIGLTLPVAPSAGDPMGLYAVTNYLFTGADTTVIGESLVAFYAAPDDATRDEIVAAVEADAFDQVALIPIVNPDMYFAIGDSVTGLELTPWGFYRPGDLANG